MNLRAANRLHVDRTPSTNGLKDKLLKYASCLFFSARQVQLSREAGPFSNFLSLSLFGRPVAGSGGTRRSRGDGPAEQES